MSSPSPQARCAPHRERFIVDLQPHSLSSSVHCAHKVLLLAPGRVFAQTLIGRLSCPWCRKAPLSACSGVARRNPSPPQMQLYVEIPIQVLHELTPPSLRCCPSVLGKNAHLAIPEQDTHTTVGKRLVMPACQQRNILSYPNRPQHGFDLIQHAMLIAAKTSLELAQLRIVHVRQIKLPHNEPNVCVQVMSASVLDIAPLRERPPPRSVIDSSRDIRASTNMRPSGFHPMLANARQNAFTHCGTHIDPGRQILRTSERQHVQPIGLRQVLSIRRHRDHGM
ncbi:Uncharacterised protein [Pseudomonas aeruginosa]|nr:Uncharacterised protein [Pseudomonas aeruginosa]